MLSESKQTCRADLNFVVDFGSRVSLAQLRPDGILFYAENGIFHPLYTFPQI